MNGCAIFASLLTAALASTAAADHDPPKEKIVALHFPKIAKQPGRQFSSVRIALSCARVSAITYIPNDWYVQTLRPAHSDDPRWKEFMFASQGVELDAGHGASSLSDLSTLDGAVRIAIEDATCFDITAIVEDELGGMWPKTTLGKKDLVLR